MANAWGGGPPLPRPPQVLNLTRSSGEKGFGLVLEAMVVADVVMGSAAARGRADEFAMGRRLTHVNDMPVFTVGDVERLTRGLEAKFRFASLADAVPGDGHSYNSYGDDTTPPHPSNYQPRPPWNARHGVASPHGGTLTPEHPSGPGRLANIQTPHEYASGGMDVPGDVGDIVVRIARPSADIPLGIILREPGLTLERVETGSPADRAGLKRLIGHQLTHSGGRYVVMTYDVAATTEGLISIEFRFKPKKCGVVVRRRNHFVPWGFGINAVTLDIVDIIEGGPGDAGGLEHWLGHQVTHVNGLHVKSAFELVSVMGNSNTKELELRFCPWSLEECAQLPISREIEEVPVAFAPGQSLGMGLSAVMVLVDVVPGSPADQQNLLDYTGWCLTHVDQVPVFTSHDVQAQTANKTTARLRFEEVMVDTLVSPDQLAQENVNISKYREWLSRRSTVRDRAKRATAPTKSHTLPLRARQLPPHKMV
eukprot:TRINITY_DN22834_c0_g1_i1.p1 TRINITY_DN22834_c0_g1~~TRINITY_DN22834_c0_g1_i1.p1  ORF type:complete len:480 (+),score=88.35 TRINITY_DN22834_c0_g1_i1:45-1484(+)